MKKIYLILSLILFSVSCSAQSRYVSQTTKKVVFARDGGTCQCCGSYENLEYDHISPYSCGGNGDASNIQLLCRKCNRSKSNSCYCKIHHKKVGINCCKGGTAATTTKSSQSSSTAKQCTGTTKKGARCKNRTKSSSGRCHHH
jgi:hypothetical protein